MTRRRRKFFSTTESEVTPPPPPPPPPAGNLFSIEHFQYDGAIKFQNPGLPGIRLDGDPKYGGFRVDETAGYVYMTGHKGTSDMVARFPLVPFVISPTRDLADLNETSPVAEPVLEYLGGQGTVENPGLMWSQGGGHEWHMHGLVQDPDDPGWWLAQVQMFYNNSGPDYDSLCYFKYEDPVVNHGIHHIGPAEANLFNNKKSGRWLTPIPANWRAALDGHRMLAGGWNPQGTGESGLGPNMFAFTPDRSQPNETQLDAVVLASYELVSGPSPEWDPENSAWPYWSPGEYYGHVHWRRGQIARGIEWAQAPSGREAIILFTAQGYGPRGEYYSPPEGELPHAIYKNWLVSEYGLSEAQYQDLLEWATERSSNGRSHQCGPYSDEIHLFDPAELLRAKNGEIEVWEVRPYQVIELNATHWLTDHAYPNDTSLWRRWKNTRSAIPCPWGQTVAPGRASALPWQRDAGLGWSHYVPETSHLYVIEPHARISDSGQPILHRFTLATT